MSWFYAADGQQRGPVSESEFKTLLQSGLITPDTLVWREGMANWVPFREVERAGVPVAATVEAGPQLHSGGNPTFTEKACCGCHRYFPTIELEAFGNDLVCVHCKPQYLQKIREGIATRPVQFAGFWIRVLARFIDAFMIFIPNFFLNLLAAILGEVYRHEGPVLIASLLISLVSSAISLGYYVFFIGKYGATPGKMCLGCKVVCSDGSKVTYPRALARCLAEIASALPLGIGYLMAAFNREKCALHDLICDTRVVKK